MNDKLIIAKVLTSYSSLVLTVLPLPPKKTFPMAISVSWSGFRVHERDAFELRQLSEGSLSV